MTQNNRSADGPGPNRWEVFYDFINSADANDMVDALTGSGTVGPAAADDADHDDSCGIIEFATGAAVGSAGWTSPDTFRGGTSPYLEMRVKLPATVDNIDFSAGFDNVGKDTSAKILYVEDTGTWTFKVESGIGADTTTDATAVAATAGWHILRIEVDAAVEARFYVDDVLVSTVGAAGVPEGADEMGFFIDAAVAVGSTESIFLDWIRIWGERK